MSSFNKVILMGNLTRDPQLKYLPSSVAICEFGIAVNEKFKDRESVMFVDCSAFKDTAELINTHFQKGKSILIEGKLKFDTWEDKQGGGKRSKHTVVVDRFQFVGSRGDSEGGSQSSAGAGDRRQSGPPPRQQQGRPPQRPQEDAAAWEDDSIPF